MRASERITQLVSEIKIRHRDGNGMLTGTPSDLSEPPVGILRTGPLGLSGGTVGEEKEMADGNELNADIKMGMARLNLDMATQA